MKRDEQTPISTQKLPNLSRLPKLGYLGIVTTVFLSTLIGSAIAQANRIEVPPGDPVSGRPAQGYRGYLCLQLHGIQTGSRQTINWGSSSKSFEYVETNGGDHYIQMYDRDGNQPFSFTTTKLFNQYEVVGGGCEAGANNPNLQTNTW